MALPTEQDILELIAYLARLAGGDLRASVRRNDVPGCLVPPRKSDDPEALLVIRSLLDAGVLEAHGRDELRLTDLGAERLPTSDTSGDGTPQLPGADVVD